jgi:hypothetical protein
MRHPRSVVFLILLSVAAALASASGAAAGQAGGIAGRVIDETGAPLPGVTIVLTPAAGPDRQAVTGADGRYAIAGVAAGPCRIAASALNFATTRRAIVAGGGANEANFTLHLSMRADVLVTAKGSFRTLADIEHPEESLIGVAAAASEGAVTSRQIESRPIMRAGEVLETVPGVIISQHSGEGKANQYYLRGFNLDHGTDFATTVAGLPVNLPTHAHGQGYADLNFLIPELVTGVQYRKGPYFAETGDFSAAGSATINYASTLERPLIHARAGGEGWQRALVAASPRFGGGHLLMALEVNHNDGPWVTPDDYGRLNGVLRYTVSRGARTFSLTGMGYSAAWNSTDQVPDRAIAGGLIPRFGSIDATDGGTTSRASAIAEYQRMTSTTATRATAYLSRYRLDLFSNFTYALDDPIDGDQFEQADRRWIAGGRLGQRRLSRRGGRSIETMYGIEMRQDAIPLVGLFHTAARTRLGTIRQDRVTERSAGTFAQATIDWTPWLRTSAGLRVDGYQFHVDAIDPANSGEALAGLASPKASLVLGPFDRTEIYVNAGDGFHSNDARGVTISRDPSSGDPASPVTPLVRAKGAEIGLRTVVFPRVQTTIAVWRLGLASELLFVGDAGTTEGSRPSGRYGLESATYVRLASWLDADADLAWSHARFTDPDPAGSRIPGATERVASMGLTIEPTRRLFGSIRLRYVGPRALIEDDSVRSASTTLFNAQAGIRLSPQARIVVDGFNLFDAAASDIEYFYTSRLPGEPVGGIEDVHTHPALPRTVRVGLQWAF